MTRFLTFFDQSGKLLSIQTDALIIGQPLISFLHEFDEDFKVPTLVRCQGRVGPPFDLAVVREMVFLQPILDRQEVGLMVRADRGGGVYTTQCLLKAIAKEEAEAVLTVLTTSQLIARL